MIHTLPVLSAADLTPAAPPRWCPGCGNYAVLEQLKKALAQTGRGRGGLAVVGGVGCAGRTPHYVDVPGLQALPGRAFAAAVGLAAADPAVQVWVVTGDADAVRSAGLLHLVRRDAPVKVLVLNNEVGGLGGGGRTAAARPGKAGEPALSVLVLALAAGATFAARAVDVDAPHLAAVLGRAAEHPGAAVVEVLQNCRVFNDGAWAAATDRALRPDGVALVEHGKPVRFGRDDSRGVSVAGLALRVGPAGAGDLVHDEAADPVHAQLLARMGDRLPVALGVLRAAPRGVPAPPPARGGAADLLAQYRRGAS